MANGFNQFQCPLCGRSVSIRKFDPENFVNDVIGISFVGLGYGRGFGVADKGSILDSGDPILDLIANRVLEISRFMMDAGIITENSLAYHLPVLESNKESQSKLESEVDALEVDNEELRNKNVRLDSEVDALEVDVENLERKNAGLKNEVEELREQLESITEDEGDDEIDDDIAEIASMLERVIGPEFHESYDESEYPLENLKNMTAFLINEYDALLE